MVSNQIDSIGQTKTLMMPCKSINFFKVLTQCTEASYTRQTTELQVNKKGNTCFSFKCIRGIEAKIIRQILFRVATELHFPFH